MTHFFPARTPGDLPIEDIHLGDLIRIESDPTDNSSHFVPLCVGFVLKIDEVWRSVGLNVKHRGVLLVELATNKKHSNYLKEGRDQIFLLSRVDVK